MSDTFWICCTVVIIIFIIAVTIESVVGIRSGHAADIEKAKLKSARSKDQEIS